MSVRHWHRCSATHTCLLPTSPCPAPHPSLPKSTCARATTVHPAAHTNTHLHQAALARADGLQQGASLRLDQQAVILLVLCAPDLQHTHRLVAQLDGTHVDLRTQRVDNLLHHVAVAAGALQAGRAEQRRGVAWGEGYGQGQDYDGSWANGDDASTASKTAAHWPTPMLAQRQHDVPAGAAPAVGAQAQHDPLKSLPAAPPHSSGAPHTPGRGSARWGWPRPAPRMHARHATASETPPHRHAAGRRAAHAMQRH